MIHDLIQIIILSVVPCCLGYFLDYCLGQPGSDDPKVGEIFSGYTLWLSKRSLSPGTFSDILIQHQALLKDDDPLIRLDGETQMKKVIIESAKKLFTWQKAVGMCVFCTNVWICWITCFVFYFTVPLQVIHPIFLFLLIPIFSHTILRKL